jgi:hypothetical protein
MIESGQIDSISTKSKGRIVSTCLPDKSVSGFKGTHLYPADYLQTLKNGNKDNSIFGR